MPYENFIVKIHAVWKNLKQTTIANVFTHKTKLLDNDVVTYKYEQNVHCA